MARDKDRNQGGQDSKSERSVGNRQGTTQTGAQNSGGKNSKEDDRYTDDLRSSGDRTGSNRNKAADTKRQKWNVKRETIETSNVKFTYASRFTSCGL